jgi:hypothetical protein
MPDPNVRPDWAVDTDPDTADDYTGNPDRSPDPDGWDNEQSEESEQGEQTAPTDGAATDHRPRQADQET